MIYFRQFHDRRSHSFSYLLADLAARDAVIIDPLAAEVTLYLAVLDEIQVCLGHILLTHAHQNDGPCAAGLQQASGALLVVGSHCPLSADRTPPPQRVADGAVLVFGDEFLRCRATPGHTAGCMSYQWRDRVFTGDALPMLLPESGAATGEDPGILFDSLTRKLLTLPDETLVYPGHDFGGRRVSCIGEERDSNPGLTGATRDEFIARYRPARRNELRL
jgi:glyoxylase-like metal-dependent hydrolase (beta-lactamase superfamily II)